MNISTLIKKGITFLALLLFILDGSFAEVIREQQAPDKKVVVNFNALALQAAYSGKKTKPIQFIGNRKARELGESDVYPPDAVFRFEPKWPVQTTMQKAANPSPPPVVNFNGLNDNSTSIPPDVNGAVGPDHLMITLNTQVRIQDKEGNVLSTITLDNFWSPLGGLTSTYDPKILYDHFADRWMICASANPQSNSSSTLIAVSQTSDPTGNWNLYKYDVDATNARWVDYPSIGFNEKWIVVGMNLFPMTNQSTAHKIYVYDKADLYANGTGVNTTFFITNEGAAVVCPSINYDASSDKIYLFRTLSSGGGTIEMKTISGPVGNEVLSSVTVLTAGSGWGSSGNNNTNFGPQLGTDKLIATNDHRIRHVVLRDSKLWVVHTVFLPAALPTRCGVQYWETDTLGNILQRGRIEDPNGIRFFSFPSIAVNNKNDVLIGYASYSSDQYVGGSYSFRKASDPVNTFKDEYFFKSGESVYFKDFGSSRNRWGDYSNTVIDPTNDSVFWTIQEYAGFPSNQWATWWAKIDPYTDVADFKADRQVICVDESVTFSDQSTFTGNNYSWTFAGGTPSVSTLPNPTVSYAASGRYEVTLTLDGKLQKKSNYVIVNTPPLKGINVSNTSPCVGQSVMLTAAQGGGVYVWNTGAATRSINVTQAGDYYCDVIASNGTCSGRTDTISLNFSPLPSVSLEPFADVDINGGLVTLTGGSPPGGSYTGPAVNNGVFDPALAGLGTHNIGYKITENGCTNIATQPLTVTDGLSIEPGTKITALHLTPNPNKGDFELKVNTMSASQLEIKVVDVNGREVYTKTVQNASGKYQESIRLGTVAAGLYYVQIIQDGSLLTRKMVVE